MSWILVSRVLTDVPFFPLLRHTVVPLNFRIAATARYIGAENHAVYRQ